jgi:hypothetical protein
MPSDSSQAVILRKRGSLSQSKQGDIATEKIAVEDKSSAGACRRGWPDDDIIKISRADTWPLPHSRRRFPLSHHSP